MVFTELITVYGYLGVFFLTFLINVVPAFMPPTWIVLATIYILFPKLNPLWLAIGGAIFSTLGRFALLFIGKEGRFLLKKKRRAALEELGVLIKRKRSYGFLSAFIVALTPLPSNAYFIILGLMDFINAEVFLGFFLGRVISYWSLISLTRITVRALAPLVQSEFLITAIVDIIGMASVFIFALIDWNKLLKKYLVKT